MNSRFKLDLYRFLTMCFNFYLPHYESSGSGEPAVFISSLFMRLTAHERILVQQDIR